MLIKLIGYFDIGYFDILLCGEYDSKAVRSVYDSSFLTPISFTVLTLSPGCPAFVVAVADVVVINTQPSAPETINATCIQFRGSFYPLQMPFQSFHGCSDHSFLVL